MKEYKIGEEFEIYGKWYQVVNGINCDKCDLCKNTLCNDLECREDRRSDQKYVNFKLTTPPLETIQERIQTLKAELEELEKQVKEVPVMKLVVTRGDLYVEINEVLIFKIHNTGYCRCFLGINNNIELYYKWLNSGCKYDKTVVEWKGGKYELKINTLNYVCLNRCDIDYGFIFKFNTLLPSNCCKDENIVRHKVTGAAIVG